MLPNRLGKFSPLLTAIKIMAPINKSTGGTPTEQLLERLCERTFLKIWSWPRPFKADKKELCDLIAIFEDRVIVFFDRESRKFDKEGQDVELAWKRWKKTTIDKQIETSVGAVRYLSGGQEIYLDDRLSSKLPVPIPPNARIHRVVVAHGAKEACKRGSDANVSGSLAITYGQDEFGQDHPFMVSLDRTAPVHIFDSENLELVFQELDTFGDFIAYLDEKEAAIQTYDFLSYCGEEDLLAHYFLGFDDASKRYRIGLPSETANGIHIGEGAWLGFVASGPYERRKKANEVSYWWDHLIQKTSANALKGTLHGNGNLFKGQSAICEMAKERRVARRMLSQRMHDAAAAFPETGSLLVRHISFMQVDDLSKGYVFLQLKGEGLPSYDEYRECRRAMLELACGVARNKFPALKMVIGIAMEPPRLYETISEDFLLMPCEDWPEERAEHYRHANEHVRFFETDSFKPRQGRTAEFPPSTPRLDRKIGRNDPCPCGSGRKLKKCHGNQMT